MGDFYQNGLVNTLHNFRTRPNEELEAKLQGYSKRRPMGLIIPSLYSELERPALQKIVDVLKEVNYLNEIVIGLDRANAEEYEHAKEFFSVLPQHHRVIWNDGPRMMELRNKLQSKQIDLTTPGKGRNVWLSFGYMIASARSEAIALHDADIVTYNREMLARLYYPVADPTFNYKFCKGYYFRADDNKMNGRVVRLLITPFIRALKKVIGQHPFLEYLDSFRYPLAGEFSMRADVVKTIRIPYDWGLEVGILSEVERNNATNRICQVEIADRYDHKHQDVSTDDANKGLSKMSRDICKTIVGKLAADGVSFNTETFRSVKATYLRIALDFVDRYKADAEINGLFYDYHKEEQTVSLFATNVYHSGIEYIENPDVIPFMPNWKRVVSAFPNILDEFYDIVEQDNKTNVLNTSMV